MPVWGREWFRGLFFFSKVEDSSMNRFSQVSAIAVAAILISDASAQSGRFGFRRSTSQWSAPSRVTWAPAATSQAPQVSGATTNGVVTQSYYSAPQAEVPVSAGAADALDEVNQVRAARGLPTFIRDEGLAQAARTIAVQRASGLIQGHTSNDFAGVPAGTSASASGCAAWPAGTGWGSCCTYDRYTYAGAAWALGRDGRRYMQLFVR